MFNNLQICMKEDFGRFLPYSSPDLGKQAFPVIYSSISLYTYLLLDFLVTILILFFFKAFNVCLVSLCFLRIS